MIQKDLILENKLGLHARAAAKLVRLVLSFRSEVHLRPAGKRKVADAASINSLMTLGAACGTKLHVRVSGPDEREALQAIEALVRNKFGENS